MSQVGMLACTFGDCHEGQQVDADECLSYHVYVYSKNEEMLKMVA